MSSYLIFRPSGCPGCSVFIPADEFLEPSASDLDLDFMLSISSCCSDGNGNPISCDLNTGDTDLGLGSGGPGSEEGGVKTRGE